jgi:hypothetical protein
MTLDELADFALHGASMCMCQIGRALPVFLIVREDGRMLPFMMTPWRNDNERRLTMTAAREVMDACNATAYAHVYEAWTLNTKPGEPQPAVRPRENPGRIDTLIVDCHNRAGERITITAKIVTEGAVRHVGEVMVREKGAKTEFGELVNLLLPEPPAPQVH